MKDKIKKLKNLIVSKENEIDSLVVGINDLKEQIEVEEDCITIVRKSIKNIEKEIEGLENEKV